MEQPKYTSKIFRIPQAVVIGGSAGSIRVLSEMLPLITQELPFPILIALHRSANTATNQSLLKEVLQGYTKKNIVEPDMKIKMLSNTIYLAPADKHLRVLPSFHIEGWSGPFVHYSRPSIDVLFESATEVIKENLLGVVLTGANSDGQKGASALNKNNGQLIVQDFQESFIDFMPKMAYKVFPDSHIMPSEEIALKINYLAKKGLTKKVF